MVLSPDEYARRTYSCPYCQSNGKLPKRKSSAPPPEPEPSEQESTDPLDELLVAVVIEAAEAIDRLADKSDDEADAFVSDARNLNPGAISRRSLRALDDIERFVRANINEILSSEDDPRDWTAVAYPRLPAGWLRLEVMHELMDVERTLRDVRAAALNYGRFWQSNAGVGGFVKRAIDGAMNPLDGWLAFVGKNSTQTDQDFLISELADAFSEVGNSLETIREDIITKLRIKFSDIHTNATNAA
jgi:hypothetical protein